ncbi:hypothetical protein [Paraburkholderia sp.]|uniref:hypothetical protein n=1 Tax=Paraburkholderia sp. TaxID=1926495 RepID=UPI0039E380BF
MQAYVLILTVLTWLGGDIRMKTSMQEFTSLQTCMAAGKEVRDAIMEQAKAEDFLHIPRVKAVCLPK